MAEFSKLTEIGRGQLSTVWSATCTDTSLVFAVKRYNKPAMLASPLWSALKQNVQREVALLTALRGTPSVCHLYGTFEDAEGAYLVQEYCPGGDLLHVLTDFEGRVPEKVFVPLVLAPLLKCLQHMHDKGIMHRDLKPENIFVDRSGHPRLGDFGLGISFLEEDATDQVGTLDYMAPEVLLHAAHRSAAAAGGSTHAHRPPKYTHKVDTWAVGILAYEMLTGAPPFEVGSDSDTARLIMWTDVPINGTWPEHLSLEAVSFIMWALRKVPDSRPSAHEMLGHPWVTKYCPELQSEAATASRETRVRPSRTSADEESWPRTPTMGKAPLSSVISHATSTTSSEDDSAAEDEFEPANTDTHYCRSLPNILIHARVPGTAGSSPGGSPASPRSLSTTPVRPVSHSVSDLKPLISRQTAAKSTFPHNHMTSNAPVLVRSSAIQALKLRLQTGELGLAGETHHSGARSPRACVPLAGRARSLAGSPRKISGTVSAWGSTWSSSQSESDASDDVLYDAQGVFQLDIENNPRAGDSSPTQVRANATQGSVQGSPRQGRGVMAVRFNLEGSLPSSGPHSERLSNEGGATEHAAAKPGGGGTRSFPIGDTMKVFRGNVGGTLGGWGEAEALSPLARTTSLGTAESALHRSAGCKKAELDPWPAQRDASNKKKALPAFLDKGIGAKLGALRIVVPGSGGGGGDEPLSGRGGASSQPTSPLAPSPVSPAYQRGFGGADLTGKGSDRSPRCALPALVKG
eukprot:jgi/Mesvir1/22189/Mv18789-RA.1